MDEKVKKDIIKTKITMLKGIEKTVVPPDMHPKS